MNIKIIINYIRQILNIVKQYCLSITHNNKNKNDNNKKCFTVDDILFNFYNRYDYADTPVIFYIKNNIDKLFSLILLYFSDMKYKLKIGIESEFFITKVVVDNGSKNELLNFAKRNNIELINFIGERGNKQYEIQYSPYTDLNKLIDDYNIMKEYLINTFRADFSAKPFFYDSGSALQVNISINNDKNENLFSLQNDLMENAIGGLLQLTNILLPLYIYDKHCLDRYVFELNEYIYNIGKIPAPVFNSWGINNRTASIRIPTPREIFDSEKYINENKINKRIEFRVPSANANLKLTLYAVLLSIKYGIENHILPPQKTSNNMLKNGSLLNQIKIENVSFGELIKNNIIIYNK